MDVKIVDATGGPALDAVRTLFQEYSRGLGISLCFQGFEQELAGLPGRYVPPGGAILMALAGGDAPGSASDAETAGSAGERAAGCVAVRPLDEPGICEMKRLYVRPGFRGLKLGRLLAEAAIEKARAAGYRAMRLDTLPSMTRAIAMYQKLGFKDIKPYCHNPHAGVRYMELTL